MSRLGGMVRRVSRAAVLAGVVLLLAGCGTTMLTVPPGPGDYRDGFRDGCDSGYAASGNFLYVRAHDAERAEADREYDLGWQAGYGKCQARFHRIQRNVYFILRG